MAGDPVERGLIESALSTLVDEMAYTVIQTAHSEIVRDVMDFSTACCDAQGRLLAQGKTIALHLGAVPDAMDAVYSRYRDDIHPGDVFVLNDPYEGGMHLPDVFMIKPIFFEGDLLCGWVVAIAHQTDMGGRVAGSNASDSTEIFQEGLRIPPLKYYCAGVQNSTLTAMVAKNVRVPDRVLGDWSAQLAACTIGERSFLELVAKYGLEALSGYFMELLDYSEAMVRREIRSWPDGTFEYVDYLDGDGIDDTPIAIAVKLTVKGDDLEVCFEGSGRQARGAINATLSFTKSCTYLSVRSMLREDIPNNAGMFRPIRVSAPVGSIVNVRMPGAVAARALTGYRIVDAMFGALAQVVQGRVPAAGEGGNTVVCLSGWHGDRPFIVVDMLCGAWGGRNEADGVDAITNPSQNLSNTPVEILESEHPVRIERYGLVMDTAGAGRYRGGMAIEREYRVLASDGALLQLRSDRSIHAPWGLAGGGSGAVSRNFLLRGDGTESALPNKVTVRLMEGEGVRHQMAGGGGYGNPYEREVEAVLEDVIDGRISREFAFANYGVVVSEDGVADRPGQGPPPGV